MTKQSIAHLFRLDRESTTPLQAQLRARIVETIDSSVLPSGSSCLRRASWPVRFLPALTILNAEMDEGLGIFAEAFAAGAGSAGQPLCVPGVRPALAPSIHAFSKR